MQASPAIEIAKHTLLAGGLILAVGTVTGFVAQKIKIPDIALFLIVGMAIGPEALGLINIRSELGALPDHPAIWRELHPL